MTDTPTLVLEPDDSPGHPLAPYMADARRRRRRRPAPRVPRRRAIVTMVHNEPVFLPIWLSYYGRFFAPSDMYILDNETSDGSTARPGFVRIPARHDRVDVTWMRDTVQEFQHELMESYELVVVTDVDEIVAPSPRLGTLGDYLDRFDEQWVNCVGYELLHMKDSEPPLDLGRGILEQRGHWFINGAYDKPAITTSRQEWRVGFHGRSDYAYNLDPDVRLVHLHRMDYGLCLERHRERTARAWAELDEREQWSVHNRITDEAEFETWFYEDSCIEGLEIKPEEIPASWRGVF